MNRRRRLWTFSTLLAVGAGVFLLWSSCGSGNNNFNLWRSLAAPNALKHDSKARIEEARIMLDNQQYGDASTLLAEITSSSEDSNDARLLYASAIIGAAGLDIWGVVSNIATTISNESSSSLTLDGILNLIGTTVLGTGATQTARINALLQAVTVLQNAPDPTDTTLSNTNCIFAAFLSVPTIANGTAAIKALLTVLSEVSQSATDNGATCPNISDLDTAIADVTTTAASLNVVLQIAKSCTFLDLNAAAATSNNIETALSTFITAADKGCASVPSCPSSLPSCKSLFPTCVQTALSVGTSTAVAGDGKVAACEIVLNCLDPSACFSSF